MERLKKCSCGARPNVDLIEKIGIPSGDPGFQATVRCKKCGIGVVRWGMLKSWARDSAYRAWNENVWRREK